MLKIKKIKCKSLFNRDVAGHIKQGRLNCVANLSSLIFGETKYFIKAAVAASIMEIAEVLMSNVRETLYF